MHLFKFFNLYFFDFWTNFGLKCLRYVQLGQGNVALHQISPVSRKICRPSQFCNNNNNLLNRKDKAYECSVCHERYTNNNERKPKLLPCSHKKENKYCALNVARFLIYPKVGQIYIPRIVTF